jgi:PEP-CTERM motif
MERKINTNLLTTKRLAAVIALAFGGALFSPTAKAVVILPGQLLVPTGTGAFSGTKIADVTTPFTGLAPGDVVSFTGSLESQVYREVGGTLDFVYQFSDDDVPTNDAIERFTVSGFSGFSTDADYVATTGASAPEFVTRQAAPGDVVGYQFSGVAPGTDTDILVIHTNATATQSGTASFQDGGNVSIAAPVPAVPEPATIGLLALAVSGLTLRRSRA